MVWTAGHCVHAGKNGGWYRNIAFVPSYNDAGKSAAQLQNATKEEVAPYGVWWGDWAQTSDQWIEQGGATGGQGASYDFAVHPCDAGEGRRRASPWRRRSVRRCRWTSTPRPCRRSTSMTATGYPAAAPFDGQKLYQCADKPGRLSLVRVATRRCTASAAR